MVRSPTFPPFPGALVCTTTYSITTPLPNLAHCQHHPHHLSTLHLPHSHPRHPPRFLSTTLHSSRNSPAGAGKGTLFTFTSTGSTLETVYNTLTLGLSVPLCKVYFVELPLEYRILNSKSEAKLISFLRDVLGFCNNKSRGKTTMTTMGEGFVRWLAGYRAVGGVCGEEV
jgi:hypothetical protein